MNVKNLTISLALLAMISCTPSGKSGEESSDSTAMEPEEAMDQSAEEGVQPGVFFVNHTDGETVASPVIIEMGVNGMTVEPAGAITEGMGHHHIIVDGSYIEKDQIVPADATHIHFGKGQTVDTLALTPGTHTVTLQFANGIHSSYGEEWSKTITLNVE